MLQTIVTGNLGKDAVVKDVGNTKVINFSVCHTEKWTDAKGEKKETQTWIECAKWGEKTGVAPYLKKGTQVLVVGTPAINTYQKNDGTTGASFTLKVERLELIGGNKQEGAAVAQQQPSKSAIPEGKYSKVESNPVDDGDLPF